MADGRDFGTLISERRLALGYSLGQLANRVHSTASEVRAWERGDRAPDDDVVTQLASELALDADELMAAAHDVARGAEAPAPEEPEPTAVVMSPVVTEPASAEEEAGAEASDGAGGPAVAAPEGEEPRPDQVAAEDAEPTAQVAVSAAEASSAGEPSEEGDDDGSPVVAGEPEFAGEAERLADLPTEAVPVVAVPAAVAVEEVVAVKAPSHPVPAPAAQRTVAGALDPITSFLRVLFDPDRRYLFWVRTVLIFVVFIVFFRVLAWAVPAFFDTLRDILDTIESTTTDTTIPGG